MKKIELIQSKKPELINKKKVAAYCRVSLETERLRNSLSNQISYYNKIIQENPLWQMAGIYSDEAYSGANINRPGFKALIEECKKGNVDIILTKSISRFSRNTVDLINTVRELKAMKIAVVFEKEGINTLTADGELMLTLLASFAEEEVKSISSNVKWRIEKKRKEGKVHTHYRCYGYLWKGDELVVNEKEAMVVREIFKKALQGYPCQVTAKSLNEKGIKSAMGKEWDQAKVCKILNNRLYLGEITLQKYFTPSLKMKKLNKGELPKYIIENNHQAIIDKDTFNKVREINRDHSKKHLTSYSLKREKGLFDSLIFCSSCSLPLYRGMKKGIWYYKCHNKKVQEDRCRIELLREDLLYKITLLVLGEEKITEKSLKERIYKILLYRNKILEYCLTDGKRIKVMAKGRSYKNYEFEIKEVIK